MNQRMASPNNGFKTMTLLQEQLTFKLRGGLFEVQNEVGLGHSEEVYHRGFCVWMSKNDISYQTKPIYPITLGGAHVLDLIPDVIVEETLVIELKAKPQLLDDRDTVQLYNYMKRTGLSLGLLVNMGLDRVHIERHLRDLIKTESHVLGPCPSPCTTPHKIHEMLSHIYDEHQTGYSSAIMERVLSSALSLSGMNVQTHPTVESFYNGHPLGKSALDCWVINEDTVFCQTCLYDDNDFNTSRCLSFMKSLNMPQAVAVNHGKRVMEIKNFP